MLKWIQGVIYFFNVKAKTKKLEQRKKAIESWHGSYARMKKDRDRLFDVKVEIDKNHAKQQKQIQSLKEQNEELKDKYAALRASVLATPLNL
jgi:hypothetical protein